MPTLAPDASIDAFISYARVDATKMNEVSAALAAEGISVWIDREGIGPASVWREDIARALDEALTVVFLLSPAFVRSPHCRAELHEAITRRKRLIPVRIARLTAEERALVVAELSALNDIDAEAPVQAAGAKVLAATIRADPDWDADRRWLLTSARMWTSEQQDDGQLLRGAPLEAALAMLGREGKELSDLEKLFVQRSSQVAADESARLEELRQRSFARRAQISRSVLARSPRLGIALAAEIWKQADTHDTRVALSEALIAHAELDAHLEDSRGHAGQVTDLAFMDGRLVTVDDGTGAINDPRPGMLCLWDAGVFQLSDARLGGRCVVATGRETLVVGQREGLVAVRWNDEKFRLRSRWSVPLVDVRRIAHEPHDDLLAVRTAQGVALVRNGDSMVLPSSLASQPVDDLAWAGPRQLALLIDGKLELSHLSGDRRVIPLDGAARAVAGGYDGAAVLVGSDIAIVRAGVVVARWPSPLRETTFGLTWVNARTLALSGSGGAWGIPTLVLHDIESGEARSLYRETRAGLGRVVAAGGRVAAAHSDHATKSVVTWALDQAFPFPRKPSASGNVRGIVCTDSEGPAVVRADAATISWLGTDGGIRHQVSLQATVVALAAPTGGGPLVAATDDGRAHLVSSNPASPIATSAALFAGETLCALAVVAEGTEILLGTSTGRVMLLDARSLDLLAHANHHQAEVLGTVSKLTPAEAVPARGGMAWPGCRWVMLTPAMNATLISGTGWWERTTQTIVWSRAGDTLPGSGAPPASIAEGRIVVADDYSVTIHDRPRDSGVAPPHLPLIIQHDLPNPATQLLVGPTGRLIVARCAGELCLLRADEILPLARIPVADDLILHAITGDERTLLATAEERAIEISLDPTEWATLALRKATRSLNADERRTYLEGE